MKNQPDKNETWQERVRNFGIDESPTQEELESQERTWEKVSKMLEEHKKDKNKQKRKRAYYWLAAAVSVSLLLLFISKEFFSSSASLPATKDIVTHPAKINNSDLTIQKPVEHPVPSGKTYTGNNNTPAAKKIPLVKHPLLTNNTQPGYPDTIAGFAQIKQDQSNRQIINNSDTIAVAKAVTKSPLRTSHINDYTETIETTPGITMKPQPLRRFLRGTRQEETEKAAAVTPVKPHQLTKPSSFQN